MTRKRLTREESRRRTREELVAAAAGLFAERGVGGTSVEQIAERAGYSRGAFYGNFGDKNELVLELLRQRTVQELHEVREMAREAGSFEEMLQLLHEWNRARARHQPQWLSLRLELFLHALRNPELRPLLAERERLVREAIGESVVRELARRGVAPPADPRLLALIVHCLEDGLLIQQILGQGTDEAGTVGDRTAVDMVALLMRSWASLAAAGPDAGETGAGR
ncbi:MULTISPECIES: TetR/AcrR family transcriptional regulator [Streptomycetaceae]|uniref:TetR/AcrR family transcriptional regulator n=1 Tax=Streptomycetaceae TaxID=2062 RepID=UPI0002E8A5D3|nr:TetR/AcrR family transcriptional regulator [Streptantibioticus cattleyicolor]